MWRSKSFAPKGAGRAPKTDPRPSAVARLLLRYAAKTKSPGHDPTSFTLSNPSLLMADNPKLAILTTAMPHSRLTTALLIVMWIFTPRTVCLLPFVAPTMSDHECCEHMAGECGKQPMSDLYKYCFAGNRSNVG